MKNSRIKFILKTAVLAVTLAAVLSVTVFQLGKAAFRVVYPLKYSDTAQKYAEEYGVDKALVFAVIYTESHFDPEAVSQADARGLMQITPDTFAWLQTKTGEKLGEEELFDPETNIKYGCLFLSMLIDEFGDTKEAVAAYNAGRSRVNEWLSDPELSKDGKTLIKIPFSESAHYVSKVGRARNIYSNLYFTEE